MQAISLERSGYPQTAVVSLATFAALVLLALVLARWTWEWVAPRPEPHAQAATQTAARIGTAYGLFGGRQSDHRDSTVAGTSPIKLLGIVATVGGRGGYALLQLDAKQTLAVRAGEDVAPGIRLAQVGTDHVVLERGGIRETLAWPAKDSTVESPNPRPGQ